VTTAQTVIDNEANSLETESPDRNEGHVSPLREFGILAESGGLIPTSPEAWLEEFKLDSASTRDAVPSIPSFVEHYVIHDPQGSPMDAPSCAINHTGFGTSGCPIREEMNTSSIVKSTADVIAQAQVFMSRRGLQNRLPVDLNNQPRPFSQPIQSSPPSDYFSWFERKWATEGQRWKL
jgi:hypothetical protein